MEAGTEVRLLRFGFRWTDSGAEARPNEWIERIMLRAREGGKGAE
jgi:hypothetical protein